MASGISYLDLLLHPLLHSSTPQSCIEYTARGRGHGHRGTGPSCKG